MKRNNFPITELSNIITQDIDKAHPEEIVEQLHKCDLEIFDGWKSYKTVLSSNFLKQLNKVSEVAAWYLQPNTADAAGIILSGCGTSGRIAFLISRAFNKLADGDNLRPCYKYIIAGGDQALMTSVESCEDDWNAGKQELEIAAKGLAKVLYIGISCGLSAPFIGGQVEYCLQHSQRFTPYLLGFNTASQARNAAINGTDKVMLNIALEMEAEGYLLNPVVGPEPITGSSRMKCATATKMILETAFLKAHQLAINDLTPFLHDDIIKAYQTTLRWTHHANAEISHLIKMAGNSLVKGGCISYMGWDSLGIMGMIDAAECVPTFGANHDDVRCFLKSGYELLRNTDGDLSWHGEKLEIGFDYFTEKRSVALSKDDTVIFIVSNLTSEQKIELARIANLVKRQESKLGLIAINTTNDELTQIQNRLGHPHTVQIMLPSPGQDRINYSHHKFIETCVAEVSLKWVINTVSTGAHILKGKVYKNYMIDLKLTNKKLFERGIRIVVQFAKVSSDEARESLLKSIYRKDKLSSSVLEVDVSDHVKKAGYIEKVIPLAILLTKGFTVDSGLKMLENCPIIRQCIDNCGM